MEDQQLANDRALFSVEQAGVYLGGLSVHTLRKKIQSGQLKVVRLGRRTMVPRTELDRVSRCGWPHASRAESREKS
jgi:excisionase family DNA binding protein